MKEQKKVFEEPVVETYTREELVEETAFTGNLSQLAG